MAVGKKLPIRNYNKIMEGILIIDKPAGWTSYDVVNFIHRRFKIKKVGHAGTLDPLATGVLIVLLGRYTKLFRKFSSEDKEYNGTLRLGVSTDSQDADGKVIAKKEISSVNRDGLKKAFAKFSGEIEQIPPMVSALRYKGKRLYKLARQGKEVPRKPRKVSIYKFQLTDFNPPDVDFFLSCSKGTYVRTLCHDIGEILGCSGHLLRLRRIKSGDFGLNDSITIEELKKIEQKELEKRVIRI